MSRAVGHDISSVPRAAPAPAVVAGPARQAHRILYVGFVLLPIIAGLDKFFYLLAEWDVYLAPIVTRVLPLRAETIMLMVGVVEVVAGLVVAFAPRIGGYLVAVWLWAIIANLLLVPGYYDIALRDFGLSLGALALAVLSRDFAAMPRREA